MKKITILKYSKESEINDVLRYFEEIKILFPNNLIVVIPNDMDLFLDCSLEQLYNVRNTINKAIYEKEKNKIK